MKLSSFVNKFTYLSTVFVLALVLFLPDGFFPAVLGPPCSTISIIDTRFLLLLNQVINSFSISFFWATAKTCSQIFVETFTQDRSHDKDPPFPGVTQCILLHVPATINDPSSAPGFGITLPGVEMRLTRVQKSTPESSLEWCLCHFLLL